MLKHSKDSLMNILQIYVHLFLFGFYIILEKSNKIYSNNLFPHPNYLYNLPTSQFIQLHTFFLFEYKKKKKDN